MSADQASRSAQLYERRALVTGGSGFLGGHLVRHLIANGWQTSMLARRRSDMPDVPGCTVYPYGGSMEDVLHAVSECAPTAVFHIASLVLTTHTPAEIGPIIAGNVLFGTQLLEAMRQAGSAVMVNAGTGWQNYTESAPWDSPVYRPVNLYAATKQAFEDIMQFYVETGLRAATLRLFDSYGPKDRRRKLIHFLLDTLANGTPLSMSPGDQIVDLVHVGDICRAFEHAALHLMREPTHAVEIFAVSGAQRRTLREAVATFEEAAGIRLPVTFGERPHRPREVMHPWDGPALPGWQPRISLLDGFRDVIAEAHAHAARNTGQHMAARAYGAR